MKTNYSKIAEIARKWMAEYDMIDDENGVHESFDDPNPSSKSCPKCGSKMNYDSHTMTYRCNRCHHFENGISRLR